jgi:hypothetical protein
MYKAFKHGKKTDMTEEKIALLEAIHFKWNMLERGKTRPEQQQQQQRRGGSQPIVRKSPRLSKACSKI